MQYCKFASHLPRLQDGTRRPGTKTADTLPAARLKIILVASYKSDCSYTAPLLPLSRFPAVYTVRRRAACCQMFTFLRFYQVLAGGVAPYQIAGKVHLLPLVRVDIHLQHGQRQLSHFCQGFYRPDIPRLGVC